MSPDCHQPFCDVQVLVGGFEVAARVVVRDDDGAGPVRDRVGENLSGMHDSLVDEAFGDFPDRVYLMPPIERDHDEVFPASCPRSV
jgi:hypothetical protein